MSRLRLLLSVVPLALLAQTDVVTANYGNDRTNANLEETTLTTANVNPDQFGKLGALPVDGQIYAQPLLVNGVRVGGTAANVVYVATMHNSVYAFDADAPCSKAPLWTVNLGPSLPVTVLNFRDISPEIGILSTPVIDTTTRTLYAVAAVYRNGAVSYQLHALDLSSGSEKFNGPVTLAAQVNGNGDASQNGRVSLDPLRQLQRPGLLLANNRIYIGFGSVYDRAPYHGWILAYDAATLRPAAVFNDTPDGAAGGIWQSGRGIGADTDGNIYTVTGNGDYDGVTNFGESFVKLDADLHVIDWFAPADWKELSDVDYDLGSLGPVLVPGTNLVIGGDKAGNMYVVNRSSMGGLAPEGAAAPQIFAPISFGGLHNMALWPRGTEAIAYIVEEGDWTGAFRIANGVMDTSPFSQTPVTSDWPFFGAAVSANGSSNGTGILWMTSGDHSTAGVPGMLAAYDGLDVTNLLWTSEVNPDRDRLGGFAKFANPTVANGKIYVPTFSNALVVYGLLPQDGGCTASMAPSKSAVRRAARIHPD